MLKRDRKIHLYFQQYPREAGNLPGGLEGNRLPRRSNEELERLLREARTEQEKRNLVKEIRQRTFIDIKKNGTEPQKIILDKKEEFEDTNMVDILSLKKNGIYLYEYLLVNIESSITPVTKENLRVGAKFEVNFGSNKYMKDSLGAGDILPPEVDTVEINGKKGVRKNIGGRPGYYDYDGKRWIYRPIYDGDTIKIVGVSTLSEDENNKNNEVDTLFFQKRVAEQILESERLGKDPRVGLHYLSDTDYQSGFTYAQQIKEERKIQEKTNPKSRSEKEFLSFYGDYLDTICKRLNVPQQIMLAIFKNETGGFNPNARNVTSGAHGIGQIIETTWQEIQDKHLPSQGFNGLILNRNDIKHQILASTSYIAYLKNRRGDFRGALMGYFGVSESNFEQAKNQNPAVYQVMQEKNLEGPSGFETAYIFWLGLDPAILPTGYNETWASTLPKIETDSSGLPYGLDKTVGSDGSTWCGFTARENGERFGVVFPAIYNSSKALTQYTGDTSIRSSNTTTLISTALESGANVMDLVFENTRGSQMGHRACAVQSESGKWFVYDPYYALGRSDPRSPVDFEEYIQNMIQVQGKILVGAGLHKSEHPSLKKI